MFQEFFLSIKNKKWLNFICNMPIPGFKSFVKFQLNYEDWLLDEIFRKMIIILNFHIEIIFDLFNILARINILLS